MSATRHLKPPFIETINDIKLKFARGVARGIQKAAAANRKVLDHVGRALDEHHARRLGEAARL